MKFTLIHKIINQEQKPWQKPMAFVIETGHGIKIMTRPNIIVTGFMGTGKSTVGKLLAAQMGYDFVDSDELIVARSGQTVEEIFPTP